MARRNGRSAPTLNDVARHAGVSLATASRAINGSSTRTVGEDLSLRVRESARLLGYAPNANAQAMARGATQSIGVVVHDLTDPYFAAIADGLATAAARHNLFMTLSTTGNALDTLGLMVAALDSLRVRAIILVGARWKDAEVMESLQTAVTNYVDRGGRVVGLGMDFPGVDGVRVENEGGARQLADELVALGYRTPLLLAGPERHSTAQARAAAFSEQMSAHGHPLAPGHHVSCDFTRAGGAVGMRLAIEAGLRPDVVVATNDVMALGALNEARASGLQVPRDMGLAGFGDITSLVDVTPGLTTVHVPTDLLAQHALDLAVNGPGDGTGSVTVGVRVMVRDSTPPHV